MVDNEITDFDDQGIVENSVSDNNYVLIETSIIERNLENIIKFEVPIWRINNSGTFTILPAGKLDYYFGGNSSNIDLYIEKKWESRIRDNFEVKPLESVEKDSGKKTALQGEREYLSKRETYKSMNFQEREDVYNEVVDSIENLDLSNPEMIAKKIRHVMNMVRDAYIISKTSFEDTHEKSGEDNKKHVKNVARCTTNFVKNVLNILKDRKNADALMEELGKESMGATVDHMNNVFVTFSSFVYHYNTLFEQSKILQLRTEVKRKYSNFYHHQFPEQNFSSLENVFKGGIKEITEDELLQFGIGAFLHDIGKLDNIGYFESGQAYDRREVVKHAPLGYNMIVNSGEYTPEVAVIAGLHHEYYGDPTGYGLSRFLFPEKNKRYTSPRYCLTYDINDLKLGVAIGYVPAKILEVIDVYSALIDSSREYRERAYTSDEAFKIMEEEFIKKKLRLDPVLLHIFRDFIRSSNCKS